MKRQTKKTNQTMSEILTLQEAAIYLRLSPMTVMRLVQRGAIPGVKIGRLWRFSRDTIMKMVKTSSNK